MDTLVSITYEKSTSTLVCTVDGVEIYNDIIEFEFVVTDQL